MPQIELHVELRDRTATRPNVLRRAGKVPAIFYMKNETPVPLCVSAKELQLLLQKEANILDIVFPDGRIQKSVLREIQRDPVSDAFVHVDIMGISLTEKVKLHVPVLCKGISEGIKEGGVLEHALREIEIEGLPLDIPEHVEIDVSHLRIGQNVTVKDLIVDTTKVRILNDPNHVVANVSQPKVVKVEAPVVEEAAVAAEAEGEKKEEKGEKPEKAPGEQPAPAGKAPAAKGQKKE